MIFKPKLLLTILLLVTATEEQWRTAQVNYSWNFPQDHWARPGFKTEWWYFTGHLQAPENGQRFGYQFTFFRIGLSPSLPEIGSEWATQNLIMGHAAISELPIRHVFSEVLYREVPFLGGFGSYPDPLIAWSRAPSGSDRRWELTWNGEAFDFEMLDRSKKIAFTLSTSPLKPMVFQAPNGYSQKAVELSAASQYYSFTRLATQGEIAINGQKFQVTGLSWMDKEFGSNQLTSNQVGWDWFSLQLNDGREIMLYLLRNKQGNTDFARGTLISADSSVHYLGPEDWTVRTVDEWKSPVTEATYPARWLLSLPEEALHLEIVPELSNQENRSQIVPQLHYWEGAVSIQSRNGEKVGQGYVELTGYGTNSLPAI